MQSDSFYLLVSLNRPESTQSIGLFADTLFSGLKTLETINIDPTDNGVELSFLLLVLASLSFEMDTDTGRGISNSFAPNEFVELSVDSNIRGSHCFLDKLFNLSDSPGNLLLKGTIFWGERR